MTDPRRPLVTTAADGEVEERHAGLGARIVVPGEVTGWDLAVIEFHLGPRRLVPPHSHVSEDELSYILEGEVSFRVGDRTFTASPGTHVYKPRGVFHTFWNATDRSARLLEIIVPAGLEASFRMPGREGDVAGAAPPRQSAVHSDEWVPELKKRFGLKLLGE